MFNPFGFQGGTATLDPQSPGMNGQTRIAEAMNGFAPNTTGYPNYAAAGFVQPNYANVPYGVNTTPFVNFAATQTAAGIPQNIGTPGYTPYVQPFPCPTTPVNYASPIPAGMPYNPYAAPVNFGTPFGSPTNPFVNNFPVHPWIQAGIPVPHAFAGFNPVGAFPAYGTNPFVGIPAATPFAGAWPTNPFVQPGINPFCGIPTIHPITGQPIVNPFSPIGGGFNTPVWGLNNPMATPYSVNPMALTPFVNPSIGFRNAFGQPVVNPWSNPWLCGINPMTPGFYSPFFSSPVIPTGQFLPSVANPFAVNPVGVHPFGTLPQGIAPLGTHPAGLPFVAGPLGGQFGNLPFGAGIDPVTYNYLCNLACCNQPGSCFSPMGFGGYSPLGNLNPIIAARMGLGINPWSSIGSFNPMAAWSTQPTFGAFGGATNPWFGGIQNPWTSGINPFFAANPLSNPFFTAWNNPIASIGYPNLLNPFCGPTGCTIPGATMPWSGSNGSGFGSFGTPSVFSSVSSCWPTNCN